MAELSGFWTTTAGGVGHQQVSYTQSHWSTYGRIAAACSGFEGVAPGLFSELAVTYIGANHCHLATGAAMVDGKWYVNDDATQGVTVPNAGAGTVRKDRIVLECSWADYHRFG